MVKRDSSLGILKIDQDNDHSSLKELRKFANSESMSSLQYVEKAPQLEGTLKIPSKQKLV